MTNNNTTPNIELVQLDVTVAQQFVEARQLVISSLRDKNLQLHAVVNNAGIILMHFTGLVDQPDVSDFEQVCEEEIDVISI